MRVLGAEHQSLAWRKRRTASSGPVFLPRMRRMISLRLSGETVSIRGNLGRLPSGGIVAEKGLAMSLPSAGVRSPSKSRIASHFSLPFSSGKILLEYKAPPSLLGRGLVVVGL